jgi:hypothetical protein
MASGRNPTDGKSQTGGKSEPDHMAGWRRCRQESNRTIHRLSRYRWQGATLNPICLLGGFMGLGLK